MKSCMPILLVALLATAPLVGTADAKSGKDKHGHGHPVIQVVPGAHAASRTGCPPGLAKKNPPCVPPGLARGSQPYDDDLHYGIGDIIDRDYVILDDPGYYGLNPYDDYFRVGNYVYRIDRKTQAVLEFIGAFANLLN